MSTDGSGRGFTFTKVHGAIVAVVIGVIVVVVALRRDDQGSLNRGCLLSAAGLAGLIEAAPKAHSGAALLTSAGAGLACSKLANSLVSESPVDVPFELETITGTEGYSVAATELLQPAQQPTASERACLSKYASTQFMLDLCRSGALEGGDEGDEASTHSLSDLVDEVKTGVIRVEAETCDGEGVGTGVLVSPHLVATVEHVVAGASTITLKRNGKSLGSAQVVGSDSDRDLALLRSSEEIAGHEFRFAGQAPRLGDEVAVLGFPLGLPLTVTKGSVSGLTRTIAIDGVKRRHLVQTDAAVNHGNSGGPLLSTETGDVLGLVDLGTTEANGIAFAVSAKVALPLLEAWRAAPQPAAEPICDGNDPAPPTGSSVTGTVSSARYAEAVDAALIDSARTRVDLGDLLSHVNAGSIAESDARSVITEIIDQRRALLRDVTEFAPPAAFDASAQLLRASLVAAIDDDLAIENWIKAKYAGDEVTAARYWAQQLRLSNRATIAKATFLRRYNAVRQGLLGLPQLEVAY